MGSSSGLGDFTARQDGKGGREKRRLSITMSWTTCGLTPCVPITFHPSHLRSAGSPGIKTRHQEGVLDNLFSFCNVNIFCSKIHLLLWSKPTFSSGWSRGVRHSVHHAKVTHGVRGTAVLLQPTRSLENPQSTGDAGNAHATVKRRGLSLKGAHHGSSCLGRPREVMIKGKADNSPLLSWLHAH